VIKRIKKNQLDAQLILSIFRQPLHVWGASGPIISRYNRMYTTIGTYYSFFLDDCCPGWIPARTTDSHIKKNNKFQSNQDNGQSSKKNNKYQLLCTYGCTS